MVPIDIYGVKGRRTKEWHLSHPEGWEECTAEQFGKAMMILGTEDDEAAARLKLFLMFTGLSMAEIEIMREEGEDENDPPLALFAMDENEVKMLPTLDPFFGEVAFKKSLLPKVRLRLTTYIGPSTALATMTTEQFEFVELCMQRCNDKMSDENIGNLLGALYYEKRKGWNKEEIERRGKRLMRLSDELKLAAVSNYRAMRMCQKYDFPRCFEGIDEEQENRGMLGRIVSLAGPAFGPPDKVLESPLIWVLEHCEQSLIQKERMDEQAQVDA